MADACGIEDPHRTIPLRSTLLRVERVISRTEQGPIRLENEICSGKSFGGGLA